MTRTKMLLAIGPISVPSHSSSFNVKVYRKDIDWCPYVYGVGLANNGISDWPIADDVYYCGCNQGVARFFGKNSIELFIE